MLAFSCSLLAAIILKLSDSQVILYYVLSFCSVSKVMDPANILVPRDRVFGLAELRDKIFGYLDPASIKTAALVSK